MSRSGMAFNIKHAPRQPPLYQRHGGVKRGCKMRQRLPFAIVLPAELPYGVQAAIPTASAKMQGDLRI
jgi:hypothetical protein